MEGPLEQIPDHPKSPDFMYDSLNSLDYINYPLAAEPYGLAPLNLSSPLNDYAYIGASYTAGSPARPFTPTHIYPPVLSNLSAGEMSSDSMQSGRTSRGSGTHSPSLATVPRSHRYNPMSVVPPRTSGTRERKRRASKHEDFSDDDDDFQPVQTSNASNEV